MVSPSDALGEGGGVLPSSTLVQLWPVLRETWSQLRTPSPWARNRCTGAAGATLGPGLVRGDLHSGISGIAPCATHTAVTSDTPELHGLPGRGLLQLVPLVPGEDGLGLRLGLHRADAPLVLQRHRHRHLGMENAE